VSFKVGSSMLAQRWPDVCNTPLKMSFHVGSSILAQRWPNVCNTPLKESVF
jgi:hypothetical protein